MPNTMPYPSLFQTPSSDCFWTSEPDKPSAARNVSVTAMIRFMLSIVDLIGHKSRLHSLSRVLLCLVNAATGQKFSLQPIDPAVSPSVDLYLAVRTKPITASKNFLPPRNP